MKKIVTVTLPDIGEGVVEGEVIEWLKKANEAVKQDEPVVVVMTDKATVELPAPCPGKIAKQYYKPGEIAIKDKPLYDIETEESAPSPKENGKVLASPATRKLAKDLGVDLQTLKGSGPDGRVTSDDVRLVQERPKTQTDDNQIVPLIGIRNLMAKKMTQSNDTIPHFSYFEQVDATRLVQLRSRFKEEATKQGISATYIPFIIKALSLTLTKFPIANSSLDPSTNSVVIHPHHNIGIAMSSKLGLIVPVLKNVETLSLNDIVYAYEELKNRAAASQLSPSDMHDATITISNYGAVGGGMWATPIINYPEAVILALARIQKQPVVRNDEIVIRDILNLSWSFDHRIMDGEQAATISHHFSLLLQNPAALL